MQLYWEYFDKAYLLFYKFPFRSITLALTASTSSSAPMTVAPSLEVDCSKNASFCALDGKDKLFITTSFHLARNICYISNWTNIRACKIDLIKSLSTNYKRKYSLLFQYKYLFSISKWKAQKFIIYHKQLACNNCYTYCGESTSSIVVFSDSSWCTATKQTSH